jgi:hypothetical protein
VNLIEPLGLIEKVIEGIKLYFNDQGLYYEAERVFYGSDDPIRVTSYPRLMKHALESSMKSVMCRSLFVN